MSAMQKQKSHHLLPLNSMVFKSKSSSNLPLATQRNIYSSSTTTLANIPGEEQDDNITALPPPPTQPVRRKTKTQDLTASPLRLGGFNEDREAAIGQTFPRSQSMDELASDNKKHKKDSVWRRLVEAIRKSFRADKEQHQPRGLAIGGPTEFKHVQTGTACLSGQQPSANNDAEGETEDWETVRASKSFHE